ncbi:cytochrome P450 [Nocardia cerradoensis]|uniref:Putative cytochrome P450 YjiB n=1 Tax=Nocardia cerradoensis TaxID=85688 RepID=A0A231GTS5_9NOCA|nr:cytochrome P450 [Nocardia cerradoensis]NKY41863.1 cytochrome P450 [Nocardia cerradoensis]OXR39992.1 putative cytochrome P450 YjiB [Nocardia cerradoensis]
MTTTDSPMKALFDGDAKSIQCPYPSYARLRNEAPVFHDPEHDIYVVTRHADIEAVNTQPKLFSSQNPIGPTVTEAVTAIGRALSEASPEFIERVRVVLAKGDVLFTQDPPVHTRHRRVLNKALTPRAIARIEPQIREACHELIDGFATPGEPCEVEFISAFCDPAPIRVLAALLGVSAERSADFARWADAINSSTGTTMSNEALLASLDTQAEFWQFFEAEFADRVENPGDDLLTSIVQARDDDGTPLTPNEMVAFCSQLVAAGADTTSKLISSFMYMLCEDPELMARVRSHPDDLPRCLEEALRLESPIQGLFRIATADTEIGGVPIPAGAQVYVVYASGNRDESIFDEPCKYDPDRDRLRSHQAFGHGPHACLGATVARTVARISFEVLLERLADIEPAESGFVPHYSPNYIIRGMESLPLRFTGVARRGADR